MNPAKDDTERQPASSSPPSANRRSKWKRTPKRSLWRCDVCKTAKFEDKAVAIAHENACRGGEGALRSAKEEALNSTGCGESNISACPDGSGGVDGGETEGVISFLDLTQDDEDEAGASMGPDAAGATQEESPSNGAGEVGDSRREEAELETEPAALPEGNGKAADDQTREGDGASPREPTPVDPDEAKGGDPVLVECKEGKLWKAAIVERHDRDGEVGFRIHYRGLKKRNRVQDYPWVSCAKVYEALDEEEATKADVEGSKSDRKKSPVTTAAALHSSSSEDDAVQDGMGEKAASPSGALAAAIGAIVASGETGSRNDPSKEDGGKRGEGSGTGWRGLLNWRSHAGTGEGKSPASKEGKSPSLGKQRSPVAAAARAALASSSDEDAREENADTDAIIGAHVRDFLATDCDEERKGIIDKVEGERTGNSPGKGSLMSAGAGVDETEKTKKRPLKSPIALRAIAALQSSSDEEEDGHPTGTVPRVAHHRGGGNNESPSAQLSLKTPPEELASSNTQQQRKGPPPSRRCKYEGCHLWRQGGCQGYCLTHVKLVEATESSESEALELSDGSEDLDSDEEDKKQPANPLVGATAYVASGEYAGLKGMILSTSYGSWTIGNSLITRKVRATSCAFVDDGKADLDAIRRWREKSGRSHNMRIIKPGHLAGALELNEKDKKQPANPFLGATAYVISGEFEGLQGTILSTDRGCWTIDNPLITRRVQSRFCAFVDDGKGDLDAIRRLREERGQSHNMRIIKPRQSGLAGTMELSDGSEDLDSDEDMDDEEKKPPANPVVGATAYVVSGEFEGLQGTILASKHGWWTIDNPLITKGIRGKFCAFVDDGKADLDAIKGWCEQRGQYNMHIIKPGEGSDLAKRKRSTHEFESEGQGENESGRVIEGTASRDIAMGNVATSTELAKALLALDGNALSSIDCGLRQAIAKKFQQSLNPITCPAGVDQEMFDTLPRDVQMEVSASNPAEMEREAKRLKSNVTKPLGEAQRLRNFMRSGLHDTAPNIAASMAASNCASLAGEGKGAPLGSEAESSRPRRLANIGVDDMVSTRHWNDTSGELITDRPVCYNVVPQHLTMIAEELKGELLALLRGVKEEMWDKVRGAGRISRPQQVHRGYYKAHIVGGVGDHLRSLNVLPGCFQVKERAVQQLMMFLNTKDGTCDTHFDRDSSALYVISGFKIVMIAPPMPESERPHDGILHEINPFAKDRKRHGKHQWARIDLVPGDVLYIPKLWLHCIRSVGSPNTLALSFQVEQSTSGDATQKVWEPKAILPLAPAPSVVRRRTVMDDEMSAMSESAASNLFMRPPSIAVPPPSRRPQRKVHRCGICSQLAFNGDEAWILNWDANYALPPGVPSCPVSIPKHLVCFRCCPRASACEDGKWVAANEKIMYPHGAEGPILTMEEFCKQSKIDRKYFRRYAFAAGSVDDYTTKFVNGGEAIHDRLERETNRIIKSEELI